MGEVSVDLAPVGLVFEGVSTTAFENSVLEEFSDGLVSLPKIDLGFECVSITDFEGVTELSVTLTTLAPVGVGFDGVATAGFEDDAVLIGSGSFEVDRRRVGA